MNERSKWQNAKSGRATGGEDPFTGHPWPDITSDSSLLPGRRYHGR